MFTVLRKLPYLNFNEKLILWFTECTVFQKEYRPQQNRVSVSNSALCTTRNKNIYTAVCYCKNNEFYEDTAVYTCCYDEADKKCIAIIDMQFVLKTQLLCFREEDEFAKLRRGVTETDCLYIFSSKCWPNSGNIYPSIIFWDP